MKHLLAIAVCLLPMSASADVIGIWFAPDDDCTAAIVAEFDKARSSIEFQLYNATSPAIGDALIRAHKRGVKVTVLLDGRANSPPKRGKKSFSLAGRLRQAGVPVYLDRAHPIAHNKVRIIDGKLLLSGSFNDSKSANRNAENLYLEDDPAVVKRFADNFRRHLAHAEVYCCDVHCCYACCCVRPASGKPSLHALCKSARRPRFNRWSQAG